jgi:hypothetical protein
MDGRDVQDHGGDMTTLMDKPLRSGAHARTTGHACKSYAVRGRRRCRMHGGTSPGAPPGEQHPNFKHGRHTRKAKAVGKFFREMVRDAEQLVAVSRDAVGLKVPEVYRRRRHVRRALAEARAKEQQK